MERITTRLALLFVLSSPAALRAQEAPCIEWERSFGSSSKTFHTSSVKQTTDGGYVLALSIGPSIKVIGDFDIALHKLDKEGNTVWERTLGGRRNEHASAVEQTIDGGYIVAGSTSSLGAGGSDVYLVKTNADGNVDPEDPSTWEKTFGGPESDSGASVARTTDGGYVVAGWTWSFGAGELDVYLVRTDAAGNKLWERTFGGPQSDLGASVAQTTDGGYIVVGSTGSFGAGDSDDVYLIKTDADGNVDPEDPSTWEKTFGGLERDSGASVAQTTDGGYIVVGTTSSFGAGGSDVYLIKTDADGNVDPDDPSTWEKTFGGPEWDTGASVAETTDGGYIVAGSTGPPGGPEVIDLVLVRTDWQGNRTWERTSGGVGHGRSVAQTTDGGYVVAGNSSFFNIFESADAFLIKLTAEDPTPGECGQPEFLRADCNDDGSVDIADAVSALGSLFLGQGDPACEDACDSNDDGKVDISDAINTLGVLFLGSGMIPLPGVTDCGVDPTKDALGCGSHEACSERDATK